MKKNLIVLGVSLLVGGLAHSQQAAPFSNGNNGSSPSPNVIMTQPNKGNIDGNKAVIVPIENPSAPNNIMAPNQAMKQVQPVQQPVTPPVALPQDAQVYQQDNTQIRRERTSPTDAVMNLLNVDKEKIRRLNRDLYDRNQVMNELPITPPKSINDVIVAKVAPGSIAPVIRVFKNRTTSLIVTDATGQPWPIVNYDGLAEEDFIVKRLDAPAPDGYVLSVTPKDQFVSGNLAIVLKGLSMPLNIEFVPAKKEVDGTTQIRVQAMGPNSQFTTMGLPNGLDTELLNVLQGVAPVGAKELEVSTKAVQAWISSSGSMFLRTRYKVMSPAFEQVTSSPDGTYAYKMVPVEAVLFKSDDGRFGEFTVGIK